MRWNRIKKRSKIEWKMMECSKMEWNGKIRDKAAGIGLCLTMSLTLAVGALPPTPALGASPDFSRTEEEWARLQDNVMEYGEIPDLIHEYNATVQNNQYAYRQFREDYGDTNAEVSDAYYDLAQDFYNDMSGDSDAGSMMSDLQLEIQASNMMEQADNTLEDSKIYLLTYEQAEANLAAAAQSNMISYHKKKLELEQKQADLQTMEEQLRLAQVEQAAGTATSMDVLTAQENLQNAQAGISELESELTGLKESLCISLGWKYDDNPEIRNLPEPDLARIESMNPEHDLAQAIENNYTLKINKRKLENATSQTTRESLETKIKNNEKQIGASLSGVYKNVLSARLTYEQAQAAARLEESNLNLAAAQYQAGMITRPQYLEQELKARNSQLTERSASMDLFEAMETYDWSVRGLAAAE